MQYLFHLGSYVWLCVFLLIIMFSTGFVSWMTGITFCLFVGWVNYVGHGVCLFVGWVTYVGHWFCLSVGCVTSVGHWVCLFVGG